MDPTPEQAEAVATYGDGVDLVLQAGAGCGKSSTLKMIAGADRRRSMIYIAYNRSIAADAARSFPGNVLCKTGHGLAFDPKHLPRLNRPRQTALDAAKALGIERITGGIARVPTDLGAVKPLTSKIIMRFALDVIEQYCHSADDEIARRHIPKYDGLTNTIARDQIAEIVLPVARAAWADLVREDGMLKMSHDVYLKQWALSRPVLQADVVLLDEAQDTNDVLSAVLLAQEHAQRVAVGDSAQQIYCQPAGTLVTTVISGATRNRPAETMQIPIELIGTGNRVVSYGETSRRLRRSGAPVYRNESRWYLGDLITATTPSGQSSRYTVDHHCVIRWDREALRNKRIVYMMRSGDRFRIGSTTAVHESQGGRHGLALRAGQEGAEAAWILSVHDSKEEGYAAERAAQERFGVPEWTFVTAKPEKLSQADLDRKWVAYGPSRAQAEKAAEAHGLSLTNPLWQAGAPLPDFRASSVVTARNLTAGMLMLGLSASMASVPGKGVPLAAWHPVAVSREHYDGEVYSLSVGIDHTYFADGLLTHNSWRGANDALLKFERELGAETRTLSQSFRFGQPIADEANRWLYYVGTTLRLTGWPAAESTIGPIAEPDAVLCRTNAGAMSTVLESLGAGRKTALVGGGGEIKRLAWAAEALQDGRPTDHPELLAFPSWQAVREYADEEDGSLRVLVTLIDDYGTEAIIKAADSLASEDAAEMVVSTAHKAKGREWNRVRIHADFREPKPDANTGLTVLRREEARLAYVAVTRARQQLDCSALAWIDNITAVTG